MSPPKKKQPAKRKAGSQRGGKKVSNQSGQKNSGSTGKSKGSSISEETSRKVRIQKFLASAGVGSRRHCEEYVETGRVTVDGEVISDLSYSIDPGKQKIRLDGELVKAQPKRYYILNKPAGFLCTNKDPSGRPRAVDLITQESSRLFTVGRLDENSTGLIIVTNDGDLAHRLAHPRYQIPRLYRVQVVGKPTREVLSQIQKGLYFSDGRFRVRGVKKVKTQGKSTFLELRLTEGQNREIRRLMARVGHKVISLQRVGFASIKLGRLPLGKSRLLKPAELKSLLSFVETAEQELKSKKSPAKKTARKKSTTSEKSTRRKTGGTGKKVSASRQKSGSSKTSDRRSSGQNRKKTGKKTYRGGKKK